MTAGNAITTGQKLFVQYGITGVRGQVEEGLPAVLHYGLPALEQGIAAGYSLNRAGCGALLAILAHSTDTNIIARSSRARQQALAEELKALKQQNAEREANDAVILALKAGKITYLLYFFKTEEHLHV